MDKNIHQEISKLKAGLLNTWLDADTTKEIINNIETKVRLSSVGLLKR